MFQSPSPETQSPPDSNFFVVSNERDQVPGTFSHQGVFPVQYLNMPEAAPYNQQNPGSNNQSQMYGTSQTVNQTPSQTSVSSKKKNVTQGKQRSEQPTKKKKINTKALAGVKKKSIKDVKSKNKSLADKVKTKVKVKGLQVSVKKSGLGRGRGSVSLTGTGVAKVGRGGKNTGPSGRGGGGRGKHSLSLQKPGQAVAPTTPGRGRGRPRGGSKAKSPAGRGKSPVSSSENSWLSVFSSSESPHRGAKMAAAAKITMMGGEEGSN